MLKKDIKISLSTSLHITLLYILGTECLALSIHILKREGKKKQTNKYDETKCHIPF